MEMPLTSIKQGDVVAENDQDIFHLLPVCFLFHSVISSAVSRTVECLVILGCGLCVTRVSTS